MDIKEWQETSEALASLFVLLKSIPVTSERIKRNQWKSVNKNGEIEFIY